MTTAKALSRYEIRRELGRGGTGVVYEAFDAKDRSLVALKTIDPTVAEDLYRLKHEFRALVDVNHPNLVRFGELASEGGQWFFTMELVRGRDFVEYVAEVAGPGADRVEGESGVRTVAASVAEETIVEPLVSSEVSAPSSPSIVSASFPRRGFDERRLRDALRQLVSALSAIHDAGHVHRDIKPSNVLVTNEGRVVVLDFGLVTTAAGRALPVSPEMLAGTPAFMAPEQCESHVVGPAADWYATGVMLFLALTGELPFDGSTERILEAKLLRAAPAPHEKVAGLPADLDALTVALLQRDPALRPDANEIRARLGIADTSSASWATATRDASPPFVGRAEELAALERALDDVNAGPGGRFIIVEGEPGIGKSTLVQTFLRRGARRTLVLSGRCYEQEAVPFNGVDGIVDALSEYLLTVSDAEVSELTAGGVRYLAAVFPVLHRVPIIEATSARTRAVASPRVVRDQAFGEFERLLDALARNRTLVAFVDDLQWADKETVALLQRIASGPNRASCLLVATMRTGAEALAAPELLGAATRIRLSGLSPDESRELVDALWVTDVARHGARVRESLVSEAGGHPLFLAELVRSERSGHDGVRAGGELQNVLWERIQARDACDRGFLEMVAVGGAPTAYEAIAEAAEIDVGEAQTRLGSLRAAQLIRIGRRGGERVVEPYHDRVRESILAHLKSGEREGEPSPLTMRQARLGRVLLARAAEDALEERVFAIVQHLNAADALLTPSERLRVAGLNLIASRKAQLATTYERARDYARKGLALLGEGGWSDAYDLTRDLHIELMSAESAAADVPAARACFEAARAHAASEADKTTLYVVWMGLETTRGSFVGALDAARERLLDLGIRIPTRFSLRGLKRRQRAVAAAQGRRTTESLLDLPELTDPVHAGAIEVLVGLVPASFFLDAYLGAWIHLTVVALALEHGVTDATTYCFSGYGTLLSCMFGQPEAGAAFGALGLALNRRFHTERFEAIIPFLYGGWHASWVRPYADALDFLRTAHDLTRKHGDTLYEALSAMVIAFVSFCRSQSLEEVASTAAWARDIAARRNNPDVVGTGEALARYASALRGETPDPTDLSLEGSSEAAFVATLSAKTPSGTFAYCLGKTELAYLFGDAPRAAALLKEASAYAQVTFGVPTTVETCFLECLIAARLDATPSEDRSARTSRIAAMAQCERRLRVWAKNCPQNFAPHHLIASAELARVRGDARAAEVAYERAVEAARAFGSPKREALALELAAAHAHAVGDAARAARLRREAADAYFVWGAVTKADALRA